MLTFGSIAASLRALYNVIGRREWEKRFFPVPETLYRCMTRLDETLDRAWRVGSRFKVNQGSIVSLLTQSILVLSLASWTNETSAVAATSGQAASGAGRAPSSDGRRHADGD